MKGVDGRDEPGHDEKEGGDPLRLAPPLFVGERGQAADAVLFVAVKPCAAARFIISLKLHLTTF
jgi:hypothetical protein